MTDKSLLDNVKIVLRSLAVSSPSNNYSIEQLNRDYRNSEGRAIPFSKLGFHTLNDFLHSIPDTLTLNLNTGRVQPVVTTRNAHVHKFVTETKTSQKNRKSRNNANRCNVRQQNTNNQQRTVWDTVPPLYNQSYANHQYNSQNFNMNQSLLQQPNNYSRGSPGNLLAPPNSLPTNNIPSNIAMMNMLYKQNLNSLNILPLPTPLMYPNNTNMYNTNMLGAESSHRPMSCNMTNVSNDSSTFNRWRGNYQNKTEKRSPSPSSSITNDESKGLNGDVDTSSEDNVKEVDALPPIEDDDPIHLIGAEVPKLQYAKNIAAALLPTDLKSGDIHQIDITEISNSWNFFFQFYETQESVEDLHNKLSSTYEIKCEKMKIDISQIEVENMCAAFHCDKWLRAQILAEPDENDEVKLCFIDFGTISNIPVQNIRRLLPEFYEIPRLCYRGVLAFLEPLDNYIIEKTVTQMFCEMVRDKSMMAVITDFEEDAIIMTVVDTSLPNEDVIINKVLMDKLLAARKQKRDS